MEAEKPQMSGATEIAPVAQAKRENFADRIAREAKESGAFPGETPPKPKDITTLKIEGDDADVPEEIRKSPKASENFKKLRGERDDFRKKWEATDSELKKRPAAPKWEDLPEVQALKKERDDYSDRLKVLDIERHPKFVEHFDKKIEHAIATAKKVGGEHGDKLVGILRLPDSPYRTELLDNLVGDLTPIRQAQLGAILLELENVGSERATEVAKAKETHGQMLKMEQDKHQADHNRMKEEMENAFSGVIGEAQDKEKGLFVFQKRDGDEKWNAQVDEMTKNAKELFSSEIPAKDRARAALWSVAAPAFLRDALNRASEVEALKKELGELKAARPLLGGGHDSKTVSSSSGQSLIERIVAQAKDAGAVR